MHTLCPHSQIQPPAPEIAKMLLRKAIRHRLDPRHHNQRGPRAEINLPLAVAYHPVQRGKVTGDVWCCIACSLKRTI
jgi:hypothetical protein